jgi:hypothetical protein
MAKSAPRTIRDLRLAAMAGNHGAAKALLRRHGKGELAAEIHPGKPFPPRVRKMVAALTAGTGTHWERVGPDGTILNLLQGDGDPPVAVEKFLHDLSTRPHRGFEEDDNG